MLRNRYAPNRMTDMTAHQIRRLVLWAAAMVLPIVVEAQTKPIAGCVTDARSKEPLPYAMLRVVDGTSGTQTNLDGDYSFKPTTADGRIAVSCIGYRTDTLTLGELRKHPNIKLSPLEITLEAVSVSEFSKPSSLFREVVGHIPDNYHCDTTVGTYFFRRYSLTEDSLWLFCEAVADIMRPDKQYHYKSNVFNYDQATADSIRLGGNHKRYPLSRLLVYDTAMLRNMLGDSNYEKNLMVGRSQTVYNDYTAFSDIMQDTYGNNMLNGRRTRKIDKHSTLSILEDEGGERYYLVTLLTDSDSTSIVVNHNDLALVHYFNSSRHSDTVSLPWPLNRIINSIVIPYYRYQYDYAKVDDRYTLVFSMQANACRIIPPKKALIDNEVNRTFRDIITDHLIENYSVWTLVDSRPADYGFIDSAIHITGDTTLYCHDVFGHGNATDDFWQGYNTVPLETRIADKLKAALEAKENRKPISSKIHD